MGDRANSSYRKQGNACAACRHQRITCPPGCPLAPYFPPHLENTFQNARKLFGINNMLKLINNVNPLQRHIAMESIIFEANRRAFDPVGGCHHFTYYLLYLIQSYTLELKLAIQTLDLYRNNAVPGPSETPPSHYPLHPDGNHHQAPPYNNVQQHATETSLPFDFPQQVEEEHGPFAMPPPQYSLHPAESHHQAMPYNNVQQHATDTSLPFDFPQQVEEEHVPFAVPPSQYPLHPAENHHQALSYNNVQQHTASSSPPFDFFHIGKDVTPPGIIQSSDKDVSEEDVNATMHEQRKKARAIYKDQ